MLIYGKQTIYYLIERHSDAIEKLYLAKELDKKEYSRLMRMGFEIKRIPPNAAQSMCRGGNHQGFLAEVKEVTAHRLSELGDIGFVVLLSSITDMGNIGAIIRSAYALGVDALAICGIKSVQFEQLARTSSGALFELPIIIEPNIHDLLNELKTAGFALYGAVMEGKDVRALHVSGKRALVLGSEGEGIAQRVVNKLDHKVRIEMAHGFDSLNVSAAGAILIDRMR